MNYIPAMALSVYVHIPYCLQRCRYCDFTTFEQSEILPPSSYVEWVKREIRTRSRLWQEPEAANSIATSISTLYFGGGTPSLIDPSLIVSICTELANCGFGFSPNAEITIEVNPATLTAASLDTYLTAGVNRFSVGAQTFHDRLLQLCARKHSAEDTRTTLRLLQSHNLNYSFDLLFALPNQSLDDLADDLREVQQWAPPHLSAYCLTIPEGHPMNSGRPPEGDQVQMFDLIETALREVNLHRYEISNFAQPGLESQHNLAYWRDRSFWGIGVSSHSYMKNHGIYGTRFWNPKSLKLYGEQAESNLGEHSTNICELLPSDQWEQLQLHEGLTDFCHMYLRTWDGLPMVLLRGKFPKGALALVIQRLNDLVERGWLVKKDEHWRLSPQGLLLSNRVFEELTFLPSEVSQVGLT